MDRPTPGALPAVRAPTLPGATVLGLTVLGLTVLGLGFGAMAVGAIGGWAVVFFVGAAASYLADARLAGTRLRKLTARWQAGRTFRFALRELLLVALFVGRGLGSIAVVVTEFVGRATLVVSRHPISDGPTRSAVAALVVGIVVVHVGAGAAGALRDRFDRARRGLVRWANLDVDGQRSTPPPAVAGPSRVAWLHLDLFLFLAVAATWPGSIWPRATWPLVVAVALIVVVGIGRLVLAGRRAELDPTAAQSNARVHAALAALAPEVVVYFSSEVTSTYALTVWLETIDRLGQPTVIFLREAGHLDRLGPTTTPIVVVADAVAAAQFQLPSMRLALYPTSVVNNDDLLRLRGIRHVLIGHGDSDKAVTYSPLHRAFDETWVAGPAARDRYLRHDVGVRPEQIRLVGRPSLAHIRRADSPARAPYTVLYAPTWEGNFDQSDYSSVATMGAGILAGLLAGPLPIRVLLKPHPATGRRTASARRARAELERTIVAAGPPHEVVDASPQALYDAFNASDLLIADISSVVPDYLASDKPYLVTNPRALDADVLREEMKSTAGGQVLPSDLADFDAVLVESLTRDTLAPQRRALAAYFLGPPSDDPIQHFVDEVTRAVGS